MFSIQSFNHNGRWWQVVYETENIHTEAMIIGSKHGGLGAADLLLAAIAKLENATVVEPVANSIKFFIF